MTKPIQIAIFGVGRWGVHLVRNFLKHPQAQVIAIVDPNPERLAAIQQQYQLGSEVCLTPDWEAVLQRSELEAVAIATPAMTHYPLIKTALQNHCHVLAEKPLTLEVSESLELCQLAQQQQCQLVVDHTYLFHPAVRRGQTWIQAGNLGELRYGYATRTHLGPVRQDVDALWDLAIHDIAIFNAWLGETPIQVQVTGQLWLQPSSEHEVNPNFFPQGLSDLVWVRLTYPSGFQALIHLCWLNPDKQRRLGVVGSQGTLIFDEMSPSAPLTCEWGEFERQGERFIPVQQRREVISLEAVEPLGAVCDHFLDCVRTDQRSPISSGEVGTALVKVLNALTESLNQGGNAIALEP